MKRMLSLLLTCALLLALVPAQAAQLATEVGVTFYEGRTALDTSAMRDGRDSTSYACKRGKTVSLSVEVPAETPISTVYVRMKTAPTAVKLRQKQGSRYVEVASVSNPGGEFVLTAENVSGSLLLDFTLNGSTVAEITELRAYGAGTMPESLPVRTAASEVDVLLLAADSDAVDADAVQRWTEAGRSVAVAVMTDPEDPLALPDALWKAGVKTTLITLGCKALAADASDKTAESAWPTKTVTQALADLLREVKPGMVVLAASGAAETRLQTLVAAANDSAGDYAYETDSAASKGLWIADQIVTLSAAEDALAAWQGRSDEKLKLSLVSTFADAEYTDPVEIPYPDGRDAEGYLPAGEEFVYEDEDKGLWAYVSSTVQVQIVRYDQPDIPRRWFVSDVRFRTDSEQLKQVLYADASFEGQMIYPETLAQSSRLVIGINGDYYPYRVNRKTNVGNIIRNRKVLYEWRAGTQKSAFPVLDTAALHDDGSMTVYKAGEITAQELLDSGTVHDALSFGPILVRDGNICIWNGKNHNSSEPRTALGMVEPGHYVMLTVEGRFAKGVGPAGIGMNQLAALMYAQGVQQAINLDGGNTAVLLFMGKKLNRTASKSGKSETEPRNMMELFGVGTSEKVHTDALNRK